MFFSGKSNKWNSMQLFWIWLKICSSSAFESSNDRINRAILARLLKSGFLLVLSFNVSKCSQTRSVLFLLTIHLSLNRHGFLKYLFWNILHHMIVLKFIEDSIWRAVRQYRRKSMWRIAQSHIKLTSSIQIHSTCIEQDWIGVWQLLLTIRDSCRKELQVT